MKTQPHHNTAQAKGGGRRRPAQAGFSLPEILFATALTGFTAASAFSGFSMGLDLLDITRQELRATQVLEEKMEAIRLYNWDQLNTPGFVASSFVVPFNPGQTNGGVSFNGRVSITGQPVVEAAYSTNMCQVTVTVNWTTGRIARERSMTTLVSRFGIQNYVY